jgi:transcriptional regulator with XRE-family HTH domain
MSPRPGFFNALAISYNGILVDPGRAVRRMRTNPGIEMSQAELAKKTGLTQADISRIELNKANTSMATYAKLAKAMGVTLDQMFGR